MVEAVFMPRFLPHRRDFLKMASVSAAGGYLAAQQPQSFVGPAASQDSAKTDFTLRISPVTLELAPNRVLSTIGYNGASPGPRLRMKEGVPVTVNVINDTDVPELVHLHGLLIPSDVDGAEEEGTPTVPPHGSRRYQFTPTPAGTRWYHTHTMAMDDLHRGSFTGMFGFLIVDGSGNPGAFDQEHYLALRDWEPYFTNQAMDTDDLDSTGPQPEKPAVLDTRPPGLEVMADIFSINDKSLGAGEPIRVKQGERVMFHFLNASAIEIRHLALPGHKFHIVALDGNPVPNPQHVDVLSLGTAERISAVVEMKNPGVWVLGTPHDDDRRNGMGIVVEYAGRSGVPRWVKPQRKAWDYTIFGEARTVEAPVETIPLVFGKINGGSGAFNQWTINGKSFDEKAAPRELQKGRRYRLVFDNQTDDPHPVHLHRNTFELTNVYGKATAGVRKDVVLVKGYRKIEADFAPQMEGLTLFHCHQQLHMDYGFKTLFDVK